MHYSRNWHSSACCHYWLLPSVPSDFTGTSGQPAPLRDHCCIRCTGSLFRQLCFSGGREECDGGDVMKHCKCYPCTYESATAAGGSGEIGKIMFYCKCFRRFKLNAAHKHACMHAHTRRLTKGSFSFSVSKQHNKNKPPLRVHKVNNIICVAIGSSRCFCIRITRVCSCVSHTVIVGSCSYYVRFAQVFLLVMQRRPLDHPVT